MEIDTAIINPTYVQEMPTIFKVYLLWILKDFIVTDSKINVPELFISVINLFISYGSHLPKQ